MKHAIVLCLLLFSLVPVDAQQNTAQKGALKKQKATFGMGCFWCTEAIFQRLKGVSNVRSGYEGGNTVNPRYDEVSKGITGHAEVIEMVYDPNIIQYQELLEIFWNSHDPTTLNRQGADVGSQYRSVVFYHNEQQRQIAEKYKTELNKANAFGKPVVTQITKAAPFYVAEPDHQNYFNTNKNAPYCRAVIKPKIEKLEKVFRSKLKI